MGFRFFQSVSKSSRSDLFISFLAFFSASFFFRRMKSTFLVVALLAATAYAAPLDHSDDSDEEFLNQLRNADHHLADHHLADHHQADHHLADHHLADHHLADSDDDDDALNKLVL